MGSKSYKILIIEDNPDDFFLIQELLEIPEYFFDFTHAETLQNGLQLLDERNFDIILLDLGLTDSVGFSTFTKTYTHAKDVPIIILTGLHDSKMGIRAVREGAQDYLVKGQVDSNLMSRSIEYAIERKRLFKSIKEREERLEIITNNMHDIVGQVDVNGNFTYISPSVEKILGYRPEHFIGKPFFELKKLKNVILNPKFTLSPKKSEFEVKTRDGTLVWLECVSNPLFDVYNQPMGGVFSARDITERKNSDKKIQESLEEKKMLLKEIHHRVKNNLMIISSLLNLQSQYLKDKKSIDIFKESQNRARSMALIHERLYQSTDLKKIDFGDYIRTLSSELFQTFVSDPGLINLKINVEDIFLDINTAVPLGLIVNELITNSFKHAFQDGKCGNITIDFHSKNKQYVLTVADDGISFPKDLDFKNTDSLGLQLVNSLTDQIDGKIQLDKSSGTKFKVKFKEMEYKS